MKEMLGVVVESLSPDQRPWAERVSSLDRDGLVEEAKRTKSLGRIISNVGTTSPVLGLLGMFVWLNESPPVALGVLIVGALGGLLSVYIEDNIINPRERYLDKKIALAARQSGGFEPGPV